MPVSRLLCLSLLRIPQTRLHRASTGKCRIRILGEMKQFSLCILAVLIVPHLLSAEEKPLDPPYRIKKVDDVEKIRLLPPGKENPRNSEGDFIQLKNGRILFVYTHFTGGGGDHSHGHLASRFSDDGGRTWSKESETVIEREGGFNNMSVSLLRLQSGEIALFYLIKDSLADCRPFMRISTDEAKTWSNPIPCITDDVDYFVLNNDRVIQLKNGRLVFAVSLHSSKETGKLEMKGTVMSYYSDDKGQNWKRSKTLLKPEKENGDRLIAQEPGLVERKDGSLLMFIRSDAGSQLFSESTDGGETWSEPTRSTLQSPVSPASIERIPSTGDLIAIWNDHSRIPDELRGKRTPFTIALSRDEGKTWQNHITLEDDPNGWYCYTAIEFSGDNILLGHCAGDRRTGGLNFTQITSLPVAKLYADR